MLLHERAQVYKRSRGPGGAGTNFQLSVKHHQQSRALALVFTQNTPDETRDDTVRTVSTKQFVIASIPFVHGHGTCKSDCRHVSWIMDGHRSASAHSASRIHIHPSTSKQATIPPYIETRCLPPPAPATTTTRPSTTQKPIYSNQNPAYPWWINTTSRFNGEENLSGLFSCSGFDVRSCFVRNLKMLMITKIESKDHEGCSRRRPR